MRKIKNGGEEFPIGKSIATKATHALTKLGT